MDPCGTVTPDDPVALLTCQCANPWYADRREWPVGLLDEVRWLADLAAEEDTQVYLVALNWGLIACGRQ